MNWQQNFPKPAMTSSVSFTLDELGPGTDDSEIRAYARQEQRIIVTYDDHHVAAPYSEHAGVFYCPNQRLAAFTIYRIVSTLLGHYETPPGALRNTG